MEISNHKIENQKTHRASYTEKPCFPITNVCYLFSFFMGKLVKKCIIILQYSERNNENSRHHQTKYRNRGSSAFWTKLDIFILLARCYVKLHYRIRRVAYWLTVIFYVKQTLCESANFKISRRVGIRIYLKSLSQMNIVGKYWKVSWLWVKSIIEIWRLSACLVLLILLKQIICDRFFLNTYDLRVFIKSRDFNKRILWGMIGWRKEKED